jgi:outer membrane lipoprotein-sorting protein
MESCLFDTNNCWIISYPITNSLKSTSIIPEAKKISFFIDKDSYLLLKQESYNNNNKSIDSMVFKNIQTNINIPDDFFSIGKTSE